MTSPIFIFGCEASGKTVFCKILSHMLNLEQKTAKLKMASSSGGAEVMRFMTNRENEYIPTKDLVSHIIFQKESNFDSDTSLIDIMGTRNDKMKFIQSIQIVEVPGNGNCHLGNIVCTNNLPDLIYMIDVSRPHTISKTCIQMLQVLNAYKNIPMKERKRNILIIYSKVDSLGSLSISEIRNLLRLRSITRMMSNVNLDEVQVSSFNSTGMDFAITWVKRVTINKSKIK